jgi:hypothetical protein
VPKKKRSKKAPAPTLTAEGAVVISPQEWLEHDTLYERVKAFAGENQLHGARIYKPHGELTCVITIEQTFGKVDMLVHAFNKKFTDADVKRSLPLAREQGMPLLVLSVDAIPSKITTVFKGVPNIFFKRFAV